MHRSYAEYCDARHCTDAAGNPGRIEALVSKPTGAEFESVPISGCSDDRVTIWHGMSTPAIACGFHAQHAKNAVFRGHRNRAGK